VNRSSVFIIVVVVMSAFAAEAQFFEGPFGWTQGQSLTILKPGEQYVCVLTRVTGHFQGEGERVQLELEPGSANTTVWTMSGTSLQKGVSAQAYCFRKDHFLSSGSARWISEKFERFATAGSKCATATAQTWWGDAATFLTGMSGNFAGGGESVSVQQSSNGFTPSVLTAKSCQPFVRGFAYSFFAGQPHSGSVAQFWGPNGKGSAAVAGEYAAFASSLNQTKVMSVQMAPVNEAMCYFTRLGGKFRGGGEFAEIVPQVNAQGVTVWTLRVQSLQPDGVWANARCYRRQQS
jgi:hypothetical protein